jgi:hypothetical protein
MRLVAFDTETHQIGPGAVAPRIVCASFAERTGDRISTTLVAQGDVGLGGIPALPNVLRCWLMLAVNGQVRLVTHNGGYDYACVCATWPELIPLVFEALASGNCTDTLWRERLLNLSITGRLDSYELPDGSTVNIAYGLADLERQYLDWDRVAEKEDREDHWRIHYGLLDGLRADEFPEDAAAYAKKDAEGTLLVHDAQEARKAELGYASTKTEEFTLYKSFCLYLETAWGMATDQAAVAEMRVQVERVLAQNRDLLVSSGVLRPGSGPMPHKKHLNRAAELLLDLGCTDPLEDLDWAPYVTRLVELGIKFKAPVEESVCQDRLQEVAGEAYRRIGAIPTLTDGRVLEDGSVKRQIKLGDEETELLATHDPVIAQYHVRKSLRKMVTNQLPILESAPVVHFRYDALKETTRTSSYGNAKGKPALFPAANGQQVPKAIEGGDLSVDPRRGYRPRSGTVFFDVDLHCLELACVGQITHDLFGESVHLDRYNAGYDLHAYLASQILLRSTVEGAAREMRETIGEQSVAQDQYLAFQAFKKCGVPEFEKVYKTYRNLAKPIGLGFPGGIGPEKMTYLARVAYNITLTEDEARGLREMWRDVYPEMPRYFDWVTAQVDHYNEGKLRDDGRRETLYWYTTPMGAVRRGCTYCSEANGAAMQSPGAEAATAGNNAVVRACYDPTRNSVLYGCRPIAFVHDQIIGETTRDESLWHEQAMEVSRLMIEAARVALPKVKMRTEPLLTRVWSKSAEPTFDGAGRLIPWQPKEK